MPELGCQLRGWTLRLLVLPRGGRTGPAGPARHPVPAGFLPAAAGPLPGAAPAPHHRPAAVGLASRGTRCGDRRNRPRPPHHPARNPARLPQVRPAMLLQCNKTLAGSLTSQTRQTGGPPWPRERRERATTCSRSRRKAGPARRASTWRWSSETVTCTTNTTNDTDWGHHLISTQNYCKLVIIQTFNIISNGN